MAETPDTGKNIEVNFIGGQCPVQVEGYILGFEFYFRSRHQHWSMAIETKDHCIHDFKGPYFIESIYIPGDTHSAGYMPLQETISIVSLLLARYLEIEAGVPFSQGIREASDALRERECILKSKAKDFARRQSTLYRLQEWLALMFQRVLGQRGSALDHLRHK